VSPSDAARVLAAFQTPVRVSEVKKPEANETARSTAFIGVVALFAFLQQYGAWVLIGVIEEKSSRVVEVLLSAIRPRQLVAGKVLGIGATAVMQGALVAIAALVAAAATGANVFEGASRFIVLWVLLWFVLGYSTYAWLYAAIGSLISRQGDAQSAAFPLSIPILVGYISSATLLSGGDPSAFVRALSFFPLTAPMVMPMLIGAGKAAGWEIAVSIGLTVGGIAVLMRVAGDIYARAVLHTGQRLKLSQVVRGEFSAV
jgi:ABC-2 type transport system permease protein